LRYEFKPTHRACSLDFNPRLNAFNVETVLARKSKRFLRLGVFIGFGLGWIGFGRFVFEAFFAHCAILILKRV
jgi:hypothetical protein